MSKCYLCLADCWFPVHLQSPLHFPQSPSFVQVPSQLCEVPWSGEPCGQVSSSQRRWYHSLSVFWKLVGAFFGKAPTIDIEWGGLGMLTILVCEAVLLGLSWQNGPIWHSNFWCPFETFMQVKNLFLSLKLYSIWHVNSEYLFACS